MSAGSRSNQFSFGLVGRFLGYELRGYKIHRIHLGNAQGEYRLRLNSEARDDLLRAALQGDLQVGDWMEVSGIQKVKERDGCVKYKVYAVQRILEPAGEPGTVAIPPTQPGPKTQILVCQKSSCCKRGGQEVCGLLGQMIEARGLGDRVRLKGTGCLKSCAQGPNLIVGTTRYHHVQSNDLAGILDHHFPAEGSPLCGSGAGSDEDATESQLSSVTTSMTASVKASVTV